MPWNFRNVCVLYLHVWPCCTSSQWANKVSKLLLRRTKKFLVIGMLTFWYVLILIDDLMLGGSPLPTS